MNIEPPLDEPAPRDDEREFELEAKRGELREDLALDLHGGREEEAGDKAP